jgi:hypothetical protein
MRLVRGSLPSHELCLHVSRSDDARSRRRNDLVTNELVGAVRGSA